MHKRCESRCSWAYGALSVLVLEFLWSIKPDKGCHPVKHFCGYLEGPESCVNTFLLSIIPLKAVPLRSSPHMLRGCYHAAVIEVINWRKQMHGKDWVEVAQLLLWIQSDSGDLRILPQVENTIGPTETPSLTVQSLSHVQVTAPRHKQWEVMWSIPHMLCVMHFLFHRLDILHSFITVNYIPFYPEIWNK